MEESGESLFLANFYSLHDFVKFHSDFRPFLRTLYLWITCSATYDGVNRVWGLRRDPQSPCRRPYIYLHIPLKNKLRASRKNSLRVINSNCSQPAHNSCERLGVYFSVGYIYICVGSSTESAGSLRNPETWRTPSYPSKLTKVSL